jgi:unsaturated rhamnogalacturonyl hydrolase
MKNKSILLIILLSGFLSVGTQTIAFRNDRNSGLKMAILMANSEMAQFPDASTVDYDPTGRWNYTPGLISFAMINLWQATGEIKYYNYAKGYADKYIGADGSINGYKMQDYSTDMVNSGKFLFTLLEKTGDQRYKNAMKVLKTQLNGQPRTTEGGFWHKQRYPNQMWLDGLYMEAPFYAQYAKTFNEPAAFDDVINQFIVVHKHTFNPAVGLNYHGWDESREQKWADPKTGCSPNFWGRAMGWYAMALVDVLDFIPEEYPQRTEIIKILNQVARGIKKYQDPETGLWYQVLDQGSREGNYFESSASSMFTYSLLKAVRMGYIDKSYKKLAMKGYDGILKNFIKYNDNGTISLTKTCAVAGLGGSPYRDGTYEYYVKEPVRENDPKGVGPFIMASLEVSGKSK